LPVCFSQESAQSTQTDTQCRAVEFVNGHASFQVEPLPPGAKLLIVVSSLERSDKPSSFSLKAQSRSSLNPPIHDTGSRVWSLPKPASIGLRPKVSTPSMHAAVMPPLRRSFSLFAEDGDPASPGNYRQVEGRLRAVGRHIQVYVDNTSLGNVKDETLRLLVRSFDDEIWPRSVRAFGPAHDVDSDCRLTVLLTDALARLSRGLGPVDGLMRGADFDKRIAAPFGNSSDVLYLNASIASGAYLQTILAHEYTHAIVFSRRVLDAPVGQVALEEESWLDEGLTHLAEDMHGYSRENVTHRVEAYLARPEGFQLVVRDYYAARLFRSHGHRGAAYLFLRWCSGVYGPGFLPAMVCSSGRGVELVERVTGTSFDDLYRAWSVSQYVAAFEAPAGESAPALPRCTQIRADGPAHTWTSPGTATHYALLAAAGSSGVSVDLEGPPGASVQVSAVRLPDSIPELELVASRHVNAQGERFVDLTLHEREGFAVHLEAVRVLAYGRGTHDFGRAHWLTVISNEQIAAACAPAGAKLAPYGDRNLTFQPPASLAFAAPILLQATGRDTRGRAVVAWAELPPIDTTQPTLGYTGDESDRRQESGR
jgi:hypothetical protein